MKKPESSRGAQKRHAPLLVTEAILLISVGAAVLSGDWAGAFLPTALLLAALSPLVVEKWARVQIPPSLQLLYAILLLGGPYFGSHLHFYAVWAPWDTVVHVYSGFPIALGAVFALSITARRYQFSLPSWFEAVVIVSASVFIAVLWEIAEFVSDALIGTTAQLSNSDTMIDLIAGTASPMVVAAGLILFRHKRQQPLDDRVTASCRSVPR